MGKELGRREEELRCWDADLRVKQAELEQKETKYQQDQEALLKNKSVFVCIEVCVCL